MSNEGRIDGDSVGPWSISVKTVGGELVTSSEETSTTNERDFTVEVSPDDQLTSLYDQIEGVTGLKACQQRLIYRGRLIGSPSVNTTDQQQQQQPQQQGDAAPDVETKSKGDNENEEDSAATKEEQQPSQQCEKQKIKDIVGLQDGHTIHLVRRRQQPNSDGSSGGETTASGGNADASTSNNSNTDSATADLTSGSATGSLLGALLGMNSTTTSGTERATRYGRRRAHYRLTTDDLEVRDPGSMEPVRQGLMTLHTLLPHAQNIVSPACSMDSSELSPFDARRRWYKGQWIDCRDTVNQWLEATIVEIVHPDDILPPPTSPRSPRFSRPPAAVQPVTDQIVSAGDLDGRRRLLLEPGIDGDFRDDDGGALAGFRRRDTNEGVQLLLIHYNGWPHRWDEWIRSDSERIRPFRVRTRHPSASAHASPTTQSVFAEAPSTSIRSESEVDDREALIPELSRVVAQVNDLLSEVAARSNASSVSMPNADLPWASQRSTANVRTLASESLMRFNQDNDAAPASTSPGDSSAESEGPRRQELEALVPLLDRLGRTLIDTASHVAYMASSRQSRTAVSTENATTAAEEQVAALEPIHEHPSTLGGLLSLLGRDRRRQSNASGSNAAILGDTASSVGGSELASPTSDDMSIDPDYTDFAAGVVNTTRGEVRAGPRSRSTQGSDDVAGLLGAYLAAASLGNIAAGSDEADEGTGNAQGLGRLLRERGNGNGGIDIHIHAVVTAPGMGPAVGLAALGPTATATPVATPVSNILSRASERRPDSGALRVRPPAATVVQADEDLGIFADLYSETPDPVDPVNPNRVAGIDRSASSNALSEVVVSNASALRRENSDADLASMPRSSSASDAQSSLSSRASSRASSRRSQSASSLTTSRSRGGGSGSSNRLQNVLGRVFSRRGGNSSNNNNHHHSFAFE